MILCFEARNLLVGAQQRTFLAPRARLVLRAWAGAVLAGLSAGQTELYTFDGSSSDGFGYSVAGAGDVNADGFADLIIGIPAADTSGESSGSAVVYSGSDGAFLYAFDALSGGVQDYFGTAVAGAGDVNRDGFDDLLVGADQSFSGSGYARVFSGRNGQVLHHLSGPSLGSHFGGSLAGAGDVNADGFDDFIISAPENNVGAPYSGSAWVYSGGDGSVLYSFHGSSQADFLGSSVDGAGDVDGDGYADFIIGVQRADDAGQNSGSALVHSGRDGSVLYTFTGDSALDNFGVSVAGAGDVNGDGLDDLVVGAYLDDDNGSASGSARVFSGADGSVLYTFHGDSADDEFGFSVSGAGDVNGDGFADVVVGAWRDQLLDTQSGSARVFSGLNGSVLYALEGSSNNANFGGSVSAAGDVNGDGFSDVIVGEPGDGHARVFAGAPNPITPYCYCYFGGGCLNTSDDAGCLNSTGAGAFLGASGSSSVFADDLFLALRGLPAHQPGVLFMGGGQSELPFGDGQLCVVAGSFALCRFPVQSSGALGSFSLGPGIVASTQGLSAACVIDLGETWNFQALYRDPAGPCATAFNLSQALSVTFVP